MKNKLFILVIVVVLFIVALIKLQTTSQRIDFISELDLWNSVALGVDYRNFKLEDPNNVFVTRMDRNNPNLILDSSISQGYLLSGKETVLDMVLQKDQALTTWGDGWGNRTKVLAAINGSFFDLDSGLMHRGQIISGWYAKWFDPLENGSGFVWTRDRDVFIGECIKHRPEKQFIIFESGLVVEFQGVNIPRGLDQLVIYTPNYDISTHTDSTGIEILTRIDQPLGIYPSPSKIEGKIIKISDQIGNSLIPYGHIILSAQGQYRNIVLGNLVDGDRVEISQEVTHYKEDCETPLNLSWAKAFSSIGGSYYFLKNGEIRVFDDPGATNRHPRTAIAFNDSFIYFIVVDGRDNIYSQGMTIGELGSFTKYVLGAEWGIAQDGGGSSTMVIDSQVVNYPSDCGTNYYSMYLPLVLNSGNDESGKNKQMMSSNTLPTEIEIKSRLINDSALVNDLNSRSNTTSGRRNDPENCQRLVANSMMMVLVEKEEKSENFKPGDIVKLTELLNLRIGPGANYKSIVNLPKGKIGSVQSQGNGLDGIMAKGDFWWYVDFGEAAGWVPENSVIRSPE